MYFIKENGDLLRKVQEKNRKFKSKKFLKQKMIGSLCNQNVLNADLKIKICKRTRSKRFIGK